MHYNIKLHIDSHIVLVLQHKMLHFFVGSFATLSICLHAYNKKMILKLHYIAVTQYLKGIYTLAVQLVCSI